eukprot:1117646-Rhodomonas_salina.2
MDRTAPGVRAPKRPIVDQRPQQAGLRADVSSHAGRWPALRSEGRVWLQVWRKDRWLEVARSTQSCTFAMQPRLLTHDLPTPGCAASRLASQTRMWRAVVSP